MSGVSTYLLNPLDDYWIHQANLPMNMVASKDKLWLEQSWWGFFDRESGIKNAFNFWVYPNMRTASVSFTFAVVQPDGSQLSHRMMVSREITDDRTSMDIGPARAVVVKPLREWTITLDENDAIPVSCELQAHSPVPPGHCEWLEGPKVDEGESRDPDAGGYGHFNYMAPLVWDGWLKVDGKKYDVKKWLGARDRSWGILGMFRDVGIHMWIVASFKDFYVQLWYQELPDGTLRGCKGSIIDKDGRYTPIFRAIHEVEFRTGTRIPTVAKFKILDGNGKWHDLVADVLAKPYCISSGTPVGDGKAEDFWTPKGAMNMVGETFDDLDEARDRERDKILKHRIAGFTFDGTEQGEGHFEIAVSQRYGRYRNQIMGDKARHWAKV